MAKKSVRSLRKSGTIALHCNSGETLYLPPGYVCEIPEEELIGNPLAEKLKNNRSIAIDPKKEIKDTESKIAVESSFKKPEEKKTES